MFYANTGPQKEYFIMIDNNGDNLLSILAVGRPAWSRTGPSQLTLKNLKKISDGYNYFRMIRVYVLTDIFVVEQWKFLTGNENLILDGNMNENWRGIILKLRIR